MTAALLSSKYQAIAEAQSVDDFHRQIVRFADELGFRYVSAMTVIDLPLTKSDFINIDGTPEVWRGSGSRNGRSDPVMPRSKHAALSIIRDQGTTHMHHGSIFINVDNMPEAWRSTGAFDAEGRDPVMQYCKHTALPIIWDQGTYLRYGSIDQWEEQAVFGYCTGIAMAVHLPEGRHFMFGVDRDQPLDQPAQELTRMVADLHLFVVHAQETALRLFVSAEPLLDMPSLTPREKEVLCWVLEGKTAWESGRILAISEAAVNKHIQNVLRKLGAANKHQAALKARRLGLIS